jgi:RNA polymerase sigma factor (sigma-70 family)
MNDIRVDVEVRNNRILEYMEQLQYTNIAQLCKANNLNQNDVGELVRFKRFPVHSQTGKWTITAIKLAAALACEPDDLWPDVMSNLILENNINTVKISLDDVMLIRDRQKVIADVLTKLSSRESKVITERYFNDITLADLGTDLSLTREGVRQMEGRILRKLRKLDRLKECL